MADEPIHQYSDEDDSDVKDNWDDTSEDEKAPEPVAAQKPKESTRNKKKGKKVVEVPKELTPEEEAAERQRIKQQEEISNSFLAKEAFLGSGGASLDACNPVTQEEFAAFKNLLTDKITFFKPSAFYDLFLDDFMRDLAADLDVEQINRVATILSAVSSEKAKLLKAKQKKSGGGGKTRAKLNVGAKTAAPDLFDASEDAGGYFEEGADDDFM